MGITTISLRNAGIEPSISAAATTSPHSAIGPGFAITVRNRCHDRRFEPDLSVEQQRERH